MKLVPTTPLPSSDQDSTTGSSTRRHPILYEAWLPDLLLGASHEMTLMELRVYAEILGQPHKEQPEQREYIIPYSLISSVNTKNWEKNASRDVERLEKALRNRPLRLPKEEVKKIFPGRKAPASVHLIDTIFYYKDSVSLVIPPGFKTVLCFYERQMMTAGDLVTLRQFSTTASYYLYWLVRYGQKTGTSSRRLTFEEIRKELGCQFSYTDNDGWKNFRTRVLDPAVKALQGTWAECSYEVERKGRGGKVEAIILSYRPDVEMWNAQPFSWEKWLTKAGVGSGTVFQFRQLVTSREPLPNYDGKVWDDFYVQSTLQIIQEKQLDKLKEPKGKKQITNLGAYTAEALRKGTFLKQINQLYNQSRQLTLPGMPLVKPGQSGRPAKPVTVAEAQQAATSMGLSLEQLLARTNRRIEGDLVVSK